ncbi:SDR family NAD(P)-dependent oxidoreductase [Ktedonospora formicarum]|uniref:Beta-ketoacyl-ACP reductase n=1 Tax=Ktedonospora formicarum TaxID=2778364 RepID=A0A8J3HX34_9CHLR|nr:SDR family oxidoreductase [Ktedonospora formicarum]GHO45707.1 beta-ketoacyl-ACP reductase [Ktedonospora formicarum]
MELGLTNRVVLVTGSSSGIGRATALAFGREGACVGITYRSQRQQAEETARRVIEVGGQAVVIPYDLAREETIKEAVKIVGQQWGHIDVLVNNAVQWGSLEDMSKRFEEVPMSSWKPTLDLQLSGVYHTLQQVVPLMRAHGWGRIVNISSNVAEDGIPGTGAYAAAKAGLHGLTRVLARELGPAGILSNVVLPGFTLTERNRDQFPQAMQTAVAQQTPTGRLTKPEDVAALIVFLGSVANSHVNGETIRCTGGI